MSDSVLTVAGKLRKDGLIQCHSQFQSLVSQPCCTSSLVHADTSPTRTSCPAAGRPPLRRLCAQVQAHATVPEFADDAGVSLDDLVPSGVRADLRRLAACMLGGGGDTFCVKVCCLAGVELQPAAPQPCTAARSAGHRTCCSAVVLRVARSQSTPPPRVSLYAPCKPLPHCSPGQLIRQRRSYEAHKRSSHCVLLQATSASAAGAVAGADARAPVQAYVSVRQRVVERGLPPDLMAAEDLARSAGMFLEAKARL